MKRMIVFGMACGLMAGLTVQAHAYKNIYKWVKDKRVSSDRVLKEAQRQRVVPVAEAAALEMVRRILTDDLFMAQAEYHKTKHIQDAETTSDTVMPEEIVGQKEIDLIDENYRFFLQIKLKAYGGRTRISVKASPMYRIHDTDAEDEANSCTAGGTNIIVNAGAGAAVAVAAAFITPFEGLPMDYHCVPLDDAAARAGKLVRSFMYLLDKRIAAEKSAAPAEESKTAEPAAVAENGQDQAAEKAEESPAAGQPAAAAEIDLESGTVKATAQ